MKNISKRTSALLILACVLCFTCAFATRTQAAVKLSKSSLSLLEGKSATLKLTGTKKKVTWKSNRKSVATVSQTGKVTAKAPGNATISATAGNTTKKCKVTVSTDYAKLYDYQVKYGKVTINKLLRISETDLVIPDKIEGFPVTELADGLFKGCDGLESITLPAGVTKIGDSMFYECRTLRKITCESKITAVGAYAFYECNALETLPDLSGIDSIGAYTFYNCDALVSLNPVPAAVKSIGDYAFFDCDKLLTYFVPETVTSIGDYAFKSCDSLLSFSGCKNVATIGAECFADCKQLNSISLGNKLTTLGTGCFSGCEKLGSVSFSSTLTSIPDKCFYNCYAISNVTIPPNVTKIGNMAFFNCIKLSILTIPGTGITSIAPDSFAGVPLSGLGIWHSTSAYLDSWLTQLKLQGLSAGNIHTIG